jgi:hypothetical protein
MLPIKPEYAYELRNSGLSGSYDCVDRVGYSTVATTHQRSLPEAVTTTETVPSSRGIVKCDKSKTITTALDQNLSFGPLVGRHPAASRRRNDTADIYDITVKRIPTR